MGERRDRILAAAADLFAAKGYSNATMSDVVAAVGGSKATLYRHFRSKEELLRATLQLQGSYDGARFKALIDDSQPITERVRAFCLDYLRYLVRPEVVQQRRLTRFEAGRSDMARKIYEEMVVPAWLLIANTFANAMARGEMRQADPWRAAVHLKSLIEGDFPDLLTGDMADPPSDEQTVAAAADIAEVFLRGYRPD